MPNGRSASPKRGKISKELRQKVLRRDGWKCVECGRGRAEGAVLHLDHIRPVARWGRTEFCNLRVLCSRCNAAKSDKAPSRSALFIR